MRRGDDVQGYKLAVIWIFERNILNFCNNTIKLRNSSDFVIATRPDITKKATTTRFSIINNGATFISFKPIIFVIEHWFQIGSPTDLINFVFEFSDQKYDNIIFASVLFAYFFGGWGKNNFDVMTTIHDENKLIFIMKVICEQVELLFFLIGKHGIISRKWFIPKFPLKGVSFKINASRTFPLWIG